MDIIRKAERSVSQSNERPSRMSTHKESNYSKVQQPGDDFTLDISASFSKETTNKPSHAQSMDFHPQQQPPKPSKILQTRIQKKSPKENRIKRPGS